MACRGVWNTWPSGLRSPQNPPASPSGFVVTGVPRAMYFTHHGHPWLKPIILRICIAQDLTSCNRLDSHANLSIAFKLCFYWKHTRFYIKNNRIYIFTVHNRFDSALLYEFFIWVLVNISPYNSQDVTKMNDKMMSLNTLRPRQNDRHFADDTFKRIFLNENVRISIKISLKFVP